MPHDVSDHFQGKTVVEHLKEARAKGMQASAEMHGTEISGKQAAFADALRDSALATVLLWLLLEPFLDRQKALLLLVIFLFGWAVWKTCRSALLGKARLERLHRVIEEERWEIEHHRQQEREELMGLYQSKGFEGPLLTEVLDVLMADDNRLLQVMLEEELGLSLEAYEHPLEQAFGALLGALIPPLSVIPFFFFFPSQALLGCALFFFLAASIRTAHIEKIAPIPSLIWNLSLFFLCAGFVHFTLKLIQS